MKNSKIYQINQEFLATIVVDPDPNWNCIQPLCGSGSVFQIRIRIHSLKNRKKRLHYQKNINPNFDIISDKNIFLIFLNIDNVYLCEAWIRIQMQCIWIHNTGCYLFVEMLEEIVPPGDQGQLVDLVYPLPTLLTLSLHPVPAHAQ